MNGLPYSSTLNLSDWIGFTARQIWQTGAIRAPWISFLAIDSLVLLLGWPTSFRLADAIPPATWPALSGWVAQQALLAWVLTAQAAVLLVISFSWAAAPTWPERRLSLTAYALAAPISPSRWLFAHLAGIGLAAFLLPVTALPLAWLAAGTRPLATAVPPDLELSMAASISPVWLGLWATICFLGWWTVAVAAGTWVGLHWEPVTRRIATAGWALLLALGYAIVLFGSVGAVWSGGGGSPSADGVVWTRLGFNLNPITPVWLLIARESVPAAAGLPLPSATTMAVTAGTPLALAFLLSWEVTRRIHRLRAGFRVGLGINEGAAAHR